MPFIYTHPAPGFGDLLPGWFVVPQNPILDAMGIPPTPVAKVQSMGELLPGKFVVPQNPLIGQLAAGVMVGPGGKGTGITGCGCLGQMGCSCGNEHVNGLGGLGGVTDMFAGIAADPMQLVWIGGGMLLLFLLLGRKGGGEYKTELSRAKTEYMERVTDAKRRYGRGYSRLGRAARTAIHAY